MASGGDPCAFCNRFPCACSAMGIQRTSFVSWDQMPRDKSIHAGINAFVAAQKKAEERAKEADAIVRELAKLNLVDTCDGACGECCNFCGAFIEWPQIEWSSNEEFEAFDKARIESREKMVHRDGCIGIRARKYVDGKPASRRRDDGEDGR